MKAKILVVDDEEGLRESLSQILRLEDYQVQAVDSGEAAVDVLQKEDFDLVLLDLKMPGMDGTEVMMYTRQHAPDTDVIFLTAHGSLESAIDAIRFDVHDYIRKPASTREILTSINRALDHQADRRRKQLLLEQLDASVRRLKEAEGVEATMPQERETIPLDDEILFDVRRREIWVDDEKINLTPTEAKLLRVLYEHRGRVLSHRELVFLVQGYEITDWEAPEVMRPLVSRLRKKLQNIPGADRWIVNIRGTGYLFDRRRS